LIGFSGLQVSQIGRLATLVKPSMHRVGTKMGTVAACLARDAARLGIPRMQRFRFISHETVEILKEARRSGNHMVALHAIGRAERQLELEAGRLGAMDESVRGAMGVPVAKR
jgi:hypothetical protein